jgi:hypothetical protein
MVKLAWPHVECASSYQKQSIIQPPGAGVGAHGFAHSDWAGYSVFEEAFTAGHWSAPSLATLR